MICIMYMCESCLWSIVQCIKVLRSCECVCVVCVCVFLNPNKTKIPQLPNDRNVKEMLTHFTGSPDSLTEKGGCCIIFCYLCYDIGVGYRFRILYSVCLIRIHWIRFTVPFEIVTCVCVRSNMGIGSLWSSFFLLVYRLLFSAYYVLLCSFHLDIGLGAQRTIPYRWAQMLRRKMNKDQDKEYEDNIREWKNE